MAARRRKPPPEPEAPRADLVPAPATVVDETPGPNGLSYALADRLVESRRNMPRRFAATSNGVSPRTFERWIQIGASSGDDPICVHLARRIFEAEGIDVRESLADLRMIRSASPQAAESYLKIMHPADYGGHVRTAPDEFEDQSRNRETQDRLLASPPPRMLAKLRQHRWLQVPAGATAEEMAAVETLIANIRMRITSANALPAQSQGSSD